MKHVLDLFSGTGSATKAFEEHPDYKVTKVEKNESFEADKHRDITEMTPTDFDKDYDFIWASPPCTKFSVAAIGHHWDKTNDNYYPEKKECVQAVNTVYHTLYLINQLNPKHWVMENPRAMLRKLIGMPAGTVTYCQYGDTRMKPTDLWGDIPENFDFKNCTMGDNCHDPAPRGSQTGTQGKKDAEERAKVPYGLSKALLNSLENHTQTKQATIDEHE